MQGNFGWKLRQEKRLASMFQKHWVMNELLFLRWKIGLKKLFIKRIYMTVSYLTSSFSLTTHERPHCKRSKGRIKLNSPAGSLSKSCGQFFTHSLVSSFKMNPALQTQFSTGGKVHDSLAFGLAQVGWHPDANGLYCWFTEHVAAAIWK